MIRSIVDALKFKRKHMDFKSSPLIGIGALAAIYCGFIPQPTSASQNSVSSDGGSNSGSTNSSEDEWAIFHQITLPGTKIPDARDSYAIKRNDLGTGVQWACGWVPNNPKNPRKKHCGSSVVWVKGDHSKNPSVRHRTSLTRYGIMCNNWEYSKDQYIAYSATGDIIAQWEKLGQLRAIIPGSFEERIATAHCQNPQ